MKRKNNSAVAFITALILMFVLFSLGTGYVIISRSQTEITSNQRDALKAFYIAEAGLNETIDKIFNDAAFSQDTAPTAFGGGEYNVTLSGGKGQLVEVTSQGQCGQASRTMRTELILLSPASFSGQLGISGLGSGDGNFTGSSGNLTGLLILEGNFYKGNMNMADARSISEFEGLPEISVDFNAYKQIADYDLKKGGSKGKKDGGGQGGAFTYTFEPGTYTGIYYVRGDAVIKSDVKLNGTLVAEGTVTMDNASNVTISAEGGNPVEGYPAVIAAEGISMTGMSNSTINGLVFSQGGAINLDGVNKVTVNGSLIVGKNLSVLNGTDLNVYYDLKLQPPDFTYNVNDGKDSCTVRVVSWKGYPGT
ncbi:MAG: pilus assembly PilX N-terminal domain-containing protein [Candidatus Omnitrophica bacterium]|nr:pilus assembly PilX N-terminal domain-containing protein [Candidatus Omnitrophota bacterium]